MTVPFATSNIIGMAFGHLELSPPSSFADTTPQANDAVLNYPVALDLCLEWTDWSFASSLVLLAEIALPTGIATDPKLPHAFALPGDCIMFREVADDTVRYRLDEGILRADSAAPLTVRYTRRITDESRTSATFRQAVALQLAVLLAPRWLGVDTKRQTLVSMLDAMRRQSSKTDARTASPEAYSLSDPADWVTEALR